MALYECFANRPRGRDAMSVGCQEEWCERELILWRVVVEDLLRQFAGSEGLRKAFRICHQRVRHCVCYATSEYIGLGRTKRKSSSCLWLWTHELSLALAYPVSSSRDHAYTSLKFRTSSVRQTKIHIFSMFWFFNRLVSGLLLATSGHTYADIKLMILPLFLTPRRLTTWH